MAQGNRPTGRVKKVGTSGGGNAYRRGSGLGTGKVGGYTRPSSDMPGSGGGNQYHSVDAPVTIQVSAPAASPEAVGRSVYDLTQRHILKTLEGVFR